MSYYTLHVHFHIACHVHIFILHTTCTFSYYMLRIHFHIAYYTYIYFTHYILHITYYILQMWNILHLADSAEAIQRKRLLGDLIAKVGQGIPCKLYYILDLLHITHMTYYTYDILHIWHITHITYYTYDIWHMTYDILHITHIAYYVSHMWNILDMKGFWHSTETVWLLRDLIDTTCRECHRTCCMLHVEAYCVLHIAYYIFHITYYILHIT